MIYTFVLLGNPGAQYERTRHNIARLVFAMIDDEINRIPHCEYFIPDTFMNESGKALREYLKYHEGREVVVVYDDKDLPIGTLRISYDKRDGGHNGVKNVIEHLGTQEFIRVRIGIAPRGEDGETVLVHGDMVQKYVMGTITQDEETAYRELAPAVVRAVRDIAELGYHKAMERNN